MTQQWGDFPVNTVIDRKWTTNGQDGASITRATNGTIRIYKNNSTTERSSSAGITDTEDFDGLTGVHHLRIDLSDNTDAGFYAAGNEYDVVLVGAVIDTKTVNAVIAHFSISNRVHLANVLYVNGAAINSLISGRLDVSVGTLAAGAKAEVNAEVVDCLTVDTYAEPGQSTPPATASIVTKVGYHYQWARNDKNNNGTEIKYFADDGTTVAQKQSVSEAGGTVTKGKIVSGP